MPSNGRAFRIGRVERWSIRGRSVLAVEVQDHARIALRIAPTLTEVGAAVRDEIQTHVHGLMDDGAGPLRPRQPPEALTDCDRSGVLRRARPGKGIGIAPVGASADGDASRAGAAIADIAAQ